MCQSLCARFDHRSSAFVGLASIIILFPVPGWIMSLTAKIQEAKMREVNHIEKMHHIPKIAVTNTCGRPTHGCRAPQKVSLK